MSTIDGVRVKESVMKIRFLGQCVLVASLAAAAGCGTTTQDRGMSGAGIGAAAGAIIGAVTGLSVVEGAVLGAVGGGLTGALTKPSQVNMGDPAWKQSSTAQAAPATQATPAAPQTGAAQPNLNQAVSNLQSQLAARGYDPGPIDGVMGERTRAAIRAYQRDRQMPIDGQVS
jgi:peptidoglycan hydrolase-like protein with peptidoglycan-binding domain